MGALSAKKHLFSRKRINTSGGRWEGVGPASTALSAPPPGTPGGTRQPPTLSARRPPQVRACAPCVRSQAGRDGGKGLPQAGTRVVCVHECVRVCTGARGAAWCFLEREERTGPLSLSPTAVLCLPGARLRAWPAWESLSLRAFHPLLGRGGGGGDTPSSRWVHPASWGLDGGHRLSVPLCLSRSWAPGCPFKRCFYLGRGGEGRERKGESGESQVGLDLSVLRS